MAELTHIDHGFDPVFDARSRVLVLGSFPSVLSRENAFYYGNPRNRFWRVVAACCGCDVPPNAGDPIAGTADGLPAHAATLAESVELKRKMLLAHGIALWDVVAGCDVRGSSDASIRNVVPVDVAPILRASSVRLVACNGGTSARLFRRHLADAVGDVPMVALPSTSPANAAWSVERLTAAWSEALSGHLL